jgi:hypothetical protein
MAEIYVESSDIEFTGTPGWDVFDESDWLATFRKQEDAEEYAESKRLEP